MNDLGWNLGWLAVQVGLLLAPAIGLHSLAWRRGPASAAWGRDRQPGHGRPARPLEPGAAFDRRARTSSSPVSSFDHSIHRTIHDRSWFGADDRRRSTSRPRDPRRLHRTSARLERHRAAGRRAGREVPAVGSDLGGRDARGLGHRPDPAGDRTLGGPAVPTPRPSRPGPSLQRTRRGTPPLDGLQSIDRNPRGRRPDDAGRGRLVRPLLLLPEDWRTWTEAERRAVVAHELAHVIRCDYASGLVARLAEVMNPFHPLVRWMAGRLHLEQELAADAIGARFAGGRSTYLRALSRLALRQQERPTNWPARAFLPARGTLIRRIAMLYDEEITNVDAGRWTAAGRRASMLALLVLTVGVASWKAPAGAQEVKPRTYDVNISEPLKPAPAGLVAPPEPFAMNYVPEGITGAIGLRPAMIARRLGMEAVKPFILDLGLGGDFEGLAKRLGVDMSKPGFIKLSVEDIETITSGLSFGRPHPIQKNEKGEDLHCLEFSRVTVRTIKPFDWPTFFRQWTLELEEVKQPRGVYHKAKGSKAEEAFMGCVIFQPDGRTLVFESENRVKELIAGEVPSHPAYLRGAT